MICTTISLIKQTIIYSFARTGYELRHLRKRRKEHVAYLPYSVDTNLYNDPGTARDVDASIIWNRGSGYPKRTSIKNMCTSLATNKVFVGKVFHHEYVRRLQQSRIVVNSINSFGVLNQRFTEAMACGALLMSDIPKELGAQGFVPGKHLVTYDKVSELRRLIEYYLRHQKELATIAKAGRDFVHGHHSNKVRVAQMLDKIKEMV